MLITTTVSSPINRTFRVEQVAGMFDMPLADRDSETFSIHLPNLDEPWSIGLITGPSGSGKTTIARTAFGQYLPPPFAWPTDAGIIDAFGTQPIQQITHLLTAVGLGSPRTWIRPFHVLSNGEKFRAELARALLHAAGTRDGILVIDEFTSMVDRTVARVASAAVAKAIRTGRLAVRLIAITCHDDIREWLAPDWTADLASGELSRRLLRRPGVPLRVVRCRQSVWRLFARHHYLSGRLSRGSTCYVALWSGRPVAFCAVVAQFGFKGCKRISRIVTLPDYQGLGIGVRLLERVCEHESSRGFKMSITASHPAILAYCRRSPLWRTKYVKANGNRRRKLTEGREVPTSFGRAVATFTYVGQGRSP